VKICYLLVQSEFWNVGMWEGGVDARQIAATSPRFSVAGANVGILGAGGPGASLPELNFVSVSLVREGGLSFVCFEMLKEKFG